MKREIKIYILSGILFFSYSMNLKSAAFERGFLGDAEYIGIGAVVARADRSYSIFVNPAGLTRMHNQELTLTGGALYLGLDYGNLTRVNGTYALPLGRFGTIGVGIDYYFIGVNDDNSFRYTEALYIVSYARKFASKFAVGLNMKVPRINVTLPDEEVSQASFSMGFDLGMIFVLNKYVSIGGTLYDFVTPRIGMYSDKSISSRVPVAFKMGISLDPQNKFIINADVSYNDYRIDLMGGLEFAYKNLGIRGGLQFMGITEAVNFSIGLGYTFKFKSYSLRLDYAFRISIGRVAGNAGNHFLSVSAGFPPIKRLGYSGEKREKLGFASYREAWALDFNRAKKYIKKSEYDKAESFLKSVIKKNKTHTESYYELACIYSLQYKAVDSVEMLKKVLDLDYKMEKNIFEDERLRNVRQSDVFKQMFKDRGLDVQEQGDYEGFQPTDVFEE